MKDLKQCVAVFRVYQSAFSIEKVIYYYHLFVLKNTFGPVFKPPDTHDHVGEASAQEMPVCTLALVIIFS